MASSGGEWLSIEDLMEKISNKSAQERKMSQANHLSYSARMRGRSKQPIYTSDKRAKFTQRENKKWVRFVTVLGYIFSVSLPAISLSFYYIYVWDPGYIAKPTADFSSTILFSPIGTLQMLGHAETRPYCRICQRKFPAESFNKTLQIHKTPILAAGSASNAADHLGNGLEFTKSESLEPKPGEMKVDLATILSDGLNSMESGEKTIADPVSSKVPNG